MAQTNILWKELFHSTSAQQSVPQYSTWLTLPRAVEESTRSIKVDISQQSQREEDMNVNMLIVIRWLEFRPVTRVLANWRQPCWILQNILLSRGWMEWPPQQNVHLCCCIVFEVGSSIKTQISYTDCEFQNLPMRSSDFGDI